MSAGCASARTFSSRPSARPSTSALAASSRRSCSLIVRIVRGASSRGVRLKRPSYDASLRGGDAAHDVPDVLASAMRHVADVFAADVAVLLPAADGALAPHPGVPSSFDPDASERTAARWALEHRRTAGLGTPTPLSARAIYFPLVAS